MPDLEQVAEITGHEEGCDCIECMGVIEQMAQDDAVEAELERRLFKSDMD